MQNLPKNLIFISLVLLAGAIFTSISIAGVSHIFLALGTMVYAYQNPKEYLKELNLKKATRLSLLIFIVVIVLSVISNWSEIERPLKNIFKIKYFLIPLLSLPAIKAFFTKEASKKQSLFLIRLFLISTTVATISGLIGLYTGFNPLKFKDACHETRACGLYGMYMTYGYGMALFTILASGLLIYLKELKEWFSFKFLLPVVVVNFLGLVLSYARGGMLGFVLGLPFFFLKKNPKKFLSIFFAVNGLFVILVFSTPSLKETFLSKSRSVSNTQRIGFYRTALNAFQERPLLGWGYKNYEPNVKKLKVKYDIPFPNYGADAHNIFLEVLASMGFIGFSAFLFFLITWLREAYINDGIIHKVSFPFLMTLIISGQVQNTFGDGENLFLIMIVWTLMESLPISVKKVPSNA
ncbi:MAG: O-antigen ligase [Bacteriovoracaceae bacterium]|jgi:O-antigen ligase